jgi:hypothetical protein
LLALFCRCLRTAIVSNWPGLVNAARRRRPRA